LFSFKFFLLLIVQKYYIFFKMQNIFICARKRSIIAMKIPLSKPFIDECEINAAIRVIKSGWYILGEEVKNFEKEFAKKNNAKFAVGVSSGTDALFLSLTSMGIGKGDEVITTPMSFIATANTIIYTGAKPVFVDINPETYNIDVNQIEKKITEKTKAIMPVHLYGQPAEMDAIKEIAEKHSLKIIEDACQAHNAEYKNKKVGSIGDVGCFSLYPSKNIMACGDGGIITTNDYEIAEKIKLLRNAGRTNKYIHTELGYNMRLNELQAAISRIQLSKIDEITEKRRTIAQKYNKLLSDTNLILPIEKKHVKHVFHAYTIRTERREELYNFLKNNGISCAIYYPTPIHLQPIYKKLGYANETLIKSETVSKQVISLPVYPELSEEQIGYISEKIHNFYN